MGRKCKFNSPAEMQEKIDAYFKDCEGELLKDPNTGEIIYNKFGEPVIINAKPLTVTGLALSLGFTTRLSLLNYQGRAEYRAMIEKAKLKIENYAESRLFDKDGWNGARFTLQNNFKSWDAGLAEKDDKKVPAISIICDIPKTDPAAENADANTSENGEGGEKDG